MQWPLIKDGVPQRKTLRLRNYDYATPGMYFVTLCAFNHVSLFGRIEDTLIRLSPLGELATAYWQEIPKHSVYTELDLFIVMPNHMQGLLLLTPEANALASSRTRLGASINLFKAAVTREAHRQFCYPRSPIWQRGFYDHVVRDEDDLHRIREYIATNPLRWELDRENPQRRGVDEFDTWLCSAGRCGIPAP